MRWNGKYGTKGTKWEQNNISPKLTNKFETVGNLMAWKLNAHKGKALYNSRSRSNKEKDESNINHHNGGCRA